MANITPTVAAVHIGEVWPKDVIRSQEFNLVIAPRVYRRWEFAGHGDVYHVPRIANMTANTKTAGTAWTPEALTDTEQTVTINVHQVAGFEIESITEVLSNTALAKEYKQKIGYALGRAVDVNLATLPQNFSQSQGTLGVPLVYDDTVDAWNDMTAAGVDMTDGCTWFLSPGAIAGMLKQNIFIQSLYQGDNPKAVQRAKLGEHLGAPIIMSNLTRAPSAGQSESWLQYKQSMALIMAMNVKMVSESIALDLAQVIGGHQIYGYAEVDRYDEDPANVTATDNWSVLLNTVA